MIAKDLRQAPVLGTEYSKSCGGRLGGRRSSDGVGVCYSRVSRYGGCCLVTTLYAITASFKCWRAVMESQPR